MTEEVIVTDADSVSDAATHDTDADLINALNGDDHLGASTDGDGEAEKPVVFKRKIDGKDREVTREELISRYPAEFVDANPDKALDLYSREVTAGKRFEEAANLRKEIEQQRQAQEQQHQAEQYRLAQAIQQIQQQAQQWAQEGQPNWQDLLDNNPHEYLRQKAIFEERQATLQQAQAAQAYLQQQQTQQQQQQLQQHLATEATKLVTDYLPEWADQSVRQKEEGELIEFLRGKGYNDQDLMNLNHSRASNIKLAVNAMRYEKLLEKAKAAKKPNPPEAANPVPTVGGKAGAKPRSILDPNISDAEFSRLRREQRRKGG
jgi:hypothetical protein